MKHKILISHKIQKKVSTFILYLSLFISGFSAVAQEQGDTILLTNIGIWDKSKSLIKKNQHIYIRLL